MHGLTEIISYLVRLVINCMALMCVIPTGLRWRRERQIMSQLENLASRMTMASPESLHSVMAAPAALTRINESMRRKSASRKRRLSHSSGHDNPAFVPITPNQSNAQSKNRQPQITLPIFPYYYGMYPSQNEFNASIFGMDPNQYIGPQPMISRKRIDERFPFCFADASALSSPIESKRTQSLLDFRNIIPTSMCVPPPSNKQVTDLDQPDGDSQMFNNEKPEPKKASNKHSSKNNNEDERRSAMGDPIYHTISSDKGSKALGRNCISLENLRTLTIKNDLNNYGPNLLQNNDGVDPLPASGYYILPSFPPPPMPTTYHQYFTHKVPQYMFVSPMHMQQQQQSPYMPPDYRMTFTNYGGYANPNPYAQASNANSRQSIGTESDDYRKYRDVAL